MSIQVLEACDYNDKNKEGFYRVLAADTFFCKQFLVHGEKPASARKRFRLGTFYDPFSLEDLKPILDKLEGDNKSLIIRHKYAHAKQGDIVFRRADEVKSHPSKLIAIDVDSIPLPSHIDATDLIAQGNYVCNLLHKCDPELFPDDLGFICQASAKAGLTDNIRIHLWIENSYKLTQGQLRNLFMQINNAYKENFDTSVELIDTALYHDVQAHYTSAPIFGNGVQDPFAYDKFKYPRTVYEYGSVSHIPDTVSSYSKTVRASQEEVFEYLKNVEGSNDASESLLRRLEIVREWDPSNPGLRIKVISLYHEAIQETFNIEVLDSVVRQALASKRPGREQDYINQAKAAAIIEIKNNSIRTVPKEYENLPITTLNSGNLPRFLDLEKDKIPKDGIIFLKASLGTGKTYTIEKLLEAGYIKGKFLALTDTSALVESNAARFNAGDFRTSTARLDFASGKIDRLSGTLHSLMKIKDFTRDFDFLFIDESDSVLNNLLFAKIIDDEIRFQIREILFELLTYTKVVVLSDGDISEETVAQYIELVEGNREFYRIDHYRPNLKGITAYRHSKESSLWGAVQGALEAGSKALVVTDQGPEKLNIMQKALSSVCLTKNIKVAHANSKMDSDVQQIINDTDSALQGLRVDALLCSPSVTNGVDFNYFDSVFVITKSSNHTPNMRFQALMRERDPSEIHYFFSNIKGYVTGYKDSIVDSGWFEKARHSLALRREREFRSYLGTFNYYLIRAGCKIEAVNEPFDPPDQTEAKAEYIVERTLALLNSKQESYIARHNDAYELKLMFCALYDKEPDEITYDEALAFIDSKIEHKLEFLHSIVPSFWDVIKDASVHKLMNALLTNGKLFFLATGQQARPSLASAKQILKRCGIEEKDDIPDLVDLYRKFCLHKGYENLISKQEESNEIV
jgi:hypothetical protein